jgi:nitroreductase
METGEAIRTRRTHKAFTSDPLDQQTLTELLELATWAPNHNLTNPWRFRVLGPSALARLKEAAEALDPGSGVKLDRAPTLVAVSYMRTPGDQVADEEDLCSTAVAAYLVLLGAHDRGLAGYWRTPAVLRAPSGRAALRIGDDERPLGLLYLGAPRQAQRVPERAPLETVVDWLD